MATIRVPYLAPRTHHVCSAKNSLPIRNYSPSLPSRTTRSWLKQREMRSRVLSEAGRDWNQLQKIVMHQPLMCFPRQHCSIMSSPSNTGELQPDDHDQVSPLDTVVNLYDCVNNKELKKLKELVSDDCCFEDYTFAKPLNGKQEVLQFFQKLMECMGRNVKFIIQSVCHDDLSAAITWHLGWKNNCIPFTRGCGFYECSKQENKLLIKHALIIIESPIKLGTFALALFKLVVYVFDEFPRATEKFLQRPCVVVEFLLRLYNLFLEPFVHPMLEWYINVWKFVARVIGYMLNILLHISRIFLR